MREQGRGAHECNANAHDGKLHSETCDEHAENCFRARVHCIDCMLEVFSDPYRRVSMSRTTKHEHDVNRSHEDEDRENLENDQVLAR